MSDASSTLSSYRNWFYLETDTVGILWDSFKFFYFAIVWGFRQVPYQILSDGFKIFCAEFKGLGDSLGCSSHRHRDTNKSFFKLLWHFCTIFQDSLRFFGNGLSLFLESFADPLNFSRFSSRVDFYWTIVYSCLARTYRTMIKWI